MRRSTSSALLLLAACLAAAGCYRPKLPPRTPEPQEAPAKDYDRELPAGAHALRLVTDPALLPDLDLASQDIHGLREAVANSLHYLSKPSSQQFFPNSGISHTHVVQSLEAMADLLDRDPAAPILARELRERFDVYMSVGCDDRGTVLFTGYYTPIFAASLERGGAYQHPLHALPPNHVKDPITGETKGLLRPDGTLDPEYPDREALLASGQLDGHELAWLQNPFEAYVIGVQGSAILRLPSGELYQVGYAGNNGHPYASLGRALVDEGVLAPEQLNLRSLILHFEAHPEDFDRLSVRNQRYVFFQEGEGGARGCLNEPVLAGRSLATDKSIFPRGGLCVFQTTLPTDSGGQRATTGFALDQDAGGAIRAPGRCDVYMGVGDEAGQRAGHTLSEGRLYYLLLKEARLASR
jgi:peptidoglycan lytic transglycosylase A